LAHYNTTIIAIFSASFVSRQGIALYNDYTMLLDVLVHLTCKIYTPLT